MATVYRNLHVVLRKSGSYILNVESNGSLRYPSIVKIPYSKENMEYLHRELCKRGSKNITIRGVKYRITDKNSLIPLELFC